MKVRILILSVFLFCSTSPLLANAHKFYMSISNMDYNSNNQSLEIIIKFFTDDLESVIEQENGKIPLFLASSKENPNADSLISIYVNQHFKINQNQKDKKLILLGKEADRDYTYVYIEVENFDDEDSFQLENTLFINYFEEQVNKVNFNNKSQTKSVSFHKSFTSDTL